MTARQLIIESGVKEDAELSSTLDAYMEDARQRSYAEGGEW
jgi:hypothetical protein